ncbi:Speckle-type POZ protein B [Araneus ventricosus]|uniref:Speckle-type POZ protein B n=1 Tax=Araneus ventricosus TaxID=182803 RepID=A0A4Y2LAN9_ARAVE|nr:Speckle-type POZ protein B [Araneus ventricosus]
MDSGGTKFTFKWWIEEHYYCLHDNGERLTSPEFTAKGLEGTTWTVDLYLRGRHDDDKGYISIFLSRSGEDGGPESIPLTFELSILDLGKSPFSSGELVANFEKGQAHGCPRLVEWETALILFDDDDEENRNNVLISFDDDEKIFSPPTLSVLCRMWKSEGINRRVEQVCAITRIGVENFLILHEVENFSSLEPNQKNSIHFSSNSKVGCVLCSLHLTDDGEIMVEIVPSNSNHILCILVIALLSASGDILESIEYENLSFALRQDIRKRPLKRTLTRRSILDAQNFLVDDTLRLVYRCFFSTGVEFEEILGTRHGMAVATQNQVCSNSHTERSYKASAERLRACPSVSEDLKSFYSRQRLTDVELKTKTKSFSAHTAVLCARSPVFETMMSSDMEEKSKKCLKVDDLEDDTVQQLLLFLYWDRLEYLEWDNVVKLYYAAVKYEIEKLKLICESFLADNLSTSNAGELLLLADTRNDADLKQFVEDFILENEEQVFRSDEWEKLMGTNLQLGMKAMLLRYNRK